MQPPASSMIAVLFALLLSVFSFLAPHTYHLGRAPSVGAVVLFPLVVSVGYWAILLAEMRRAELWLLAVYEYAPSPPYQA
jgi:hypothetical protein